MSASSKFAVWGVCVLLAASACLPRQTLAADLVVVTDQGAAPGVRDLAAAFAHVSGNIVTVVEERGAALEHRINEGPGDVMTGDPRQITDLVNKGKILAGTQTPYGMASLGVAVRAGAPKPDIGTVEAYKAALLAAKSIGYSFGCSGLHVAQGIEKLGLTEALKAKTVRTGSGAGGGPVTDYLARGDVELGIQQTNIMVGVPGVDYVGVPPGFLNDPCESDVGVMSISKAADAARAMIRFMSSPEAAPILRKTHVEPFKS